MRHCRLRIMRMTSKTLIVADAVGSILKPQQSHQKSDRDIAGASMKGAKSQPIHKGHFSQNCY
jgi:hypothetical protein